MVRNGLPHMFGGWQAVAYDALILFSVACLISELRLILHEDLQVPSTARTQSANAR